jgi:hypothetical protein
MDHIGIDVHKGKVRSVSWPREASSASNGSARTRTASRPCSAVDPGRGSSWRPRPRANGSLTGSKRSRPSLAHPRVGYVRPGDRSIGSRRVVVLQRAAPRGPPRGALPPTGAGDEPAPLRQRPSVSNPARGSSPRRWPCIGDVELGERRAVVAARRSCRDCVPGLGVGGQDETSGTTDRYQTITYTEASRFR